MYIWIGCQLPKDFEEAVRSHCTALNQDIGLSAVAFSLPQHVSLKISFQSDRHRDILDYLICFFEAQPPFSLRIQPAEQNGNILWLPVEDNLHLQQLHEQLDTQLRQRFDIPQHHFDTCFQFHSTLFMDSDTGKLSRMHQLLQDFPVTQELRIDTFLLGISETGKPGQYRVIQEIKV